MSDVLHTQHHERVALLTLNRPDARNALDDELRGALLAALASAARDPDVGAIVLTGAGKGFCAGADLKGGAASGDTSLRSAARVTMHDFNPLLESIVKLDKPVIAAVNGGAAGFGMSLALACDLLVMAEDAYLLSNFINIGLVPDGGATWMLLRRIGYARTFELLCDGVKVAAPQCLGSGIANRVVAPDALVDGAVQWAAELAGRAPMALSLTKRLARLSQGASLADALAIEAEMQSLCLATQDTREALLAFAEKRPPRFTGR